MLDNQMNHIIKKAKYNFILDALMLLCMSLVAGIGFLMKYMLVPGSERWIKYGRNVDLTFLGMGRHEWGSIHLFSACLGLGLLFLHILLHTQWIIATCKKIAAGRKRKFTAAILFVLACLLLLMAPFFIEPKVIEIWEGPGGFGMGFQGFKK